MKQSGPHSDHAAAAISQAMQQAAMAYNRREWAGAERLCRQILAARGDYYHALNLLGIIAAQTGRTAEAAKFLGRAAAANPGDASAHDNYGLVLKDLKRFEEALQSYARALTIKPDYAEAYNHRGVVLQELGRFEEALDSYERALTARPDLAEACINRGITLHALKRFEDALHSYERALKVRPDLAEAYNNRGNTLHELKRFEEALDSYERALKVRPDLAEACINRGNTLRDLERFEEALDSYERALKIKPDSAEACNLRGVTLQELGRFKEALDSYARALKIRTDLDWLYGHWLHARMQVCDWSDFDLHLGTFITKIEQARNATPPFVVLALADSLAVQRQAAQTWVTARYPDTPSRPAFQKRRGERIRIGYYSADYHNHATAYLIAGLFELHDRERFELVAISYGPEKRDEMRTRLSAACEIFVDVRAESDGAVASLSRDLAIDIAVDLKGFTLGARTGIFSCRAAPIQVGYLGYPATMGAPFIDYLIADPTLIPPDSRQHYAEKIVYLPHSYQVNDRKRPIADKEYSRAELGLPSTGFVFCCFNSHYKITPGTFDGWMNILGQVEGSVLWLLGDNESAASELRRQARARHVDAGRLIFAPRMPFPQHLARHRAADLFIDTLPYNAHTTASDALWAGLPVLTRIGESFAGRVAASLLNAVGLPELVTATQAQYEAAAVQLARHPARLAQIKEKLSRNRLTLPLFDTALFTRHLEDAYAQMDQRHRADLSPAHIYVAP